MAETQVLVDALPYIDQGYDDTGVREMVTAMVEEETRYFDFYKYIYQFKRLTSMFVTQAISSD